MKIIDVRENTKDGDSVCFKYGDHEDEIVHLASFDTIHIRGCWGEVLEVHESKIDDLITALQMAKKEYFGE